MGYVFDMPGEADTYEAILPGDVATRITAAIRHPVSGLAPGMEAIAVLITIEDNTVTITCDGTTPTNAAGTNAGHQLAAGDSMVLRGPNTIKNFQCVDTVSGSVGKVKITCFF